MIHSPLRLENYFFTKIHVDACPSNCEKTGQGLFTTHVSCMKHKDVERKWMVQLELQQVQDKDKGCPEYTFRVELVGFYEVSKDFPEEKTEQMVRVNGPALLYSAARELIAMLTGRGPFVPVNLQTVTFIDEAKPIHVEKGEADKERGQPAQIQEKTHIAAKRRKKQKSS
mgnify:CR=1 FL=1